jgi:hypothetical protein
MFDRLMDDLTEDCYRVSSYFQAIASDQFHSSGNTGSYPGGNTTCHDFRKVEPILMKRDMLIVPSKAISTAHLKKSVPSVIPTLQPPKLYCFIDFIMHIQYNSVFFLLVSDTTIAAKGK